MQKTVFVEIERKFLPANDGWKELLRHETSEHNRQSIKQCYLNTDPKNIVRIRLINCVGELTLKSNIKGASTQFLTRNEFNVNIPHVVAKDYINRSDNVIEKYRYTINYKGHDFYIDLYRGKHTGLVLIEVELKSENEVVELPDWVGEEVTNNPKYYNNNL